MSTSFETLVTGNTLKRFEYPELLSEPSPSQKVNEHSSQEARKDPTFTPQELATLTATARAEGFREGEERARATYESELARERLKIADALARFEKERAQYYSRAEAELVSLSLTIAGKILHRETQVDPLVLAGLVKVAVGKLNDGTTLRIRVKANELAVWRQHFEAGLLGSTKLELIPDDLLEAGTCVVESEVGSLEIGIDAQLKEVETGLLDLLKQRPS